jgi:proteic killer suppression protein
MECFFDHTDKPSMGAADVKENSDRLKILTVDGNIVRRYLFPVVELFACAETEAVFLGRASRKLPSKIQQTAKRKLVYLSQANHLDDLRSPPGNRLEALKGKRAGQMGIRINDQWRICFVWKNDSAGDVEIVDYH